MASLRPGGEAVDRGAVAAIGGSAAAIPGDETADRGEVTETGSGAATPRGRGSILACPMWGVCKVVRKGDGDAFILGYSAGRQPVRRRRLLLRHRQVPGAGAGLSPARPLQHLRSLSRDDRRSRQLQKVSPTQRGTNDWFRASSAGRRRRATLRHHRPGPQRCRMTSPPRRTTGRRTVR